MIINALKEILNIIRLYLKSCNKSLYLICITLMAYGLMIIKSVDTSCNTLFFKTQAISAIIGIITIIVISLIDYRKIIRIWKIWALLAIILIIWVSLAGIKVEGTDDTAWIKLFGGYTFQPSEIIKIVFVITLSVHISYLKKIDKINKFIGIISIAIHAGVPIAIIHFQGDDGAVIIFAIIFIVMSFCGGLPIRYFIIAFIFIIASVPFIWEFILNTPQKERISVLLSNDNSKIMTYGWQQYQGKISIALGGIKGYGLFNGERVSENIVPYQENDFIYSVVGEELGFIGCVFVLLLFLLLFISIIITAMKSTDTCAILLCYGLFALISSQMIINISMVLGFLPVIGITLPFFSAGGTSLLSICICIGIVQSIYRFNTKKCNHNLYNKDYDYISIY